MVDFTAMLCLFVLINGLAILFLLLPKDIQNDIQSDIFYLFKSDDGDSND